LNSTQDGKAIKLTTYRYPAEKTKGVVISFHTMVLYTGISSNVAKTLASNGFTFVGYDQRGHGRSEGEKGYLDDHKLILQDAVTFISSIFKIYPNTPVFLMGHSFGGLLSILLLR
jgi:acylglycerol lipase